MAGPYHLDSALGNFQEDVEKQILVEAEPDSWYRPKSGDIVTAEVKYISKGRSESSFMCTWVVGVGVDRPPFAVPPGLDVDRCIRTMRRGEVAVMKPKAEAGVNWQDDAIEMCLRGLERTEDLLGDGTLMRTTLRDGVRRESPQSGMEVRVRYSWRTVPATSCSLVAGKEPKIGAQQEADQYTLRVASTGSQKVFGTGEAGKARPVDWELAELQRALLRRRPDKSAVVLTECAGKMQLSEGPAEGTTSDGIRVISVRQGEELMVQFDAGVSPAEACAKLRDDFPVAASGATAGDEMPPVSRPAREIAIGIDPGKCNTSAEDWIPGVCGLRALTDLRETQRCLVLVDPYHLERLPAGLNLPPTSAVEYDIELLKIMVLTDVSLGGKGGTMKKITTAGEGFAKPSEGAEVKLGVEVRAGSAGAVLLEERDLTFKAASGQYCSAIDETVLTMKQGEICEVICSDPAAWVDDTLGLTSSSASSEVVMTLELLSFEAIDVYAAEEPERVAHCSHRKEVGGQFFAGKQWQRALNRYQYVANALGYVDHWQDEASKEAAIALRRVCHLNAAACWLKLEGWQEAQKSCEAVLKCEPDNVKALFRMGQALKELTEFADAEQCFKKVRELDPANKEAIKMLLKVRQLLKKEQEKKKAMFAKMSKGLGAGDSADKVGQAECESPDDVAATACEEQAPPEKLDDNHSAEEGFMNLSLVFGAVAIAAMACSMVAVMRWRRR